MERKNLSRRDFLRISAAAAALIVNPDELARAAGAALSGLRQEAEPVPPWMTEGTVWSPPEWPGYWSVDSSSAAEPDWIRGAIGDRPKAGYVKADKPRNIVYIAEISYQLTDPETNRMGENIQEKARELLGTTISKIYVAPEFKDQQTAGSLETHWVAAMRMLMDAADNTRFIWPAAPPFNPRIPSMQITATHTSRTGIRYGPDGKIEEIYVELGPLAKFNLGTDSLRPDQATGQVPDEATHALVEHPGQPRLIGRGWANWESHQAIAEAGSTLFHLAGLQHAGEYGIDTGKAGSPEEAKFVQWIIDQTNFVDLKGLGKRYPWLIGELDKLSVGFTDPVYAHLNEAIGAKIAKGFIDEGVSIGKWLVFVSLYVNNPNFTLLMPEKIKNVLDKLRDEYQIIAPKQATEIKIGDLEQALIPRTHPNKTGGGYDGHRVDVVTMARTGKFDYVSYVKEGNDPTASVIYKGEKYPITSYVFSPGSGSNNPSILFPEMVKIDGKDVPLADLTVLYESEIPGPDGEKPKLIKHAFTMPPKAVAYDPHTAPIPETIPLYTA